MILRLCLLLVVVAAAFSVSYYATSTVLAHGNHCGVGTNPPCNYGGQRDYVYQYRCCPYGIGGYLKVPDVNLLDYNCERPNTDDPGCDFVAHTVSLSTDWVFGDWAQMGFREGMWFDYASRGSPRRYWEVHHWHCGFAEEWADLGAAQGNAQNFYITWSGVSGSCPPGSPGSGYLWYLRNDSSLSTPVHQTWLKNPYGRLTPTPSTSTTRTRSPTERPASAPARIARLRAEPASKRTTTQLVPGASGRGRQCL